MPEKIAFECDDEFMSFWAEIHELRDEVKKSIEAFVKDKTLKSSLEAKIILSAGGDKLAFLKKAENELAAAFIVSDIEINDNGSELEIKVEKAEGEKCERCWTISRTVGSQLAHPTLCARCVANLS